MTGGALPVSIITGYLGAGKTTFINQLLTNPNEHIVCGAGCATPTRLVDY